MYRNHCFSIVFACVRIEGNEREVSVMQKRPLPIGIEFYKKMIDKSFYYVDKTLLIKDLLDKGGEVTLFTRPRRFGKHWH